ncbi:MAG: ABC transporter substrate-binding protein [Thermodesulfobacteriota bacterium]|jgi:ABC-type branched-subunit amino acid transport system substrate-binding protein
MKKKILISSAIFVLPVFLLIFGWLNPVPAQGATIKVGVIATMPWPVGKSAAQAVELAVKTLNDSGGLLGRKIELVQEDSRGQVPVAVEKYRKLVMVDKVAMVVVAEGGAITIACQRAGADLFGEYPHIMMNAGASAEDLPKRVREDYNAYKFFFNLYTTGPDRLLYGAMVHTYMIEKQIKPKPTKVAILGEDIPDYRPYWEGWPEYGIPPYPDLVYKDRGIQVVYTAKIAVGEKMFMPIFEQIAASGAQYIDFHMSAYSDFYILAKQWAESSARNIPMMHSGVSPKYWEATGGACLGIIGTWPSDWLDIEISSKTRGYLQGFLKAYGYSGSNWLAMGAYDSAVFWGEAVRKGKTADARALIPIMEKLEALATRGVMKVNAVDHTSHNYPYVGKLVKASIDAIVKNRPLIDLYKELKLFPYGQYPYGPIAPFAQWQDGGKLVSLYPPEVAKKTNPGKGYVSPKELRDRAKK